MNTRWARSIVMTALVAALVSVPAGAQTWKDVLGQVTGQSQGEKEQANGESASGTVTESEASSGLREALEIGVEKAVEMASARDGFFGNEAIRIPLPKPLRSVARTMRQVGLGDTADEFEETLNRAAEQASAKAMPILTDAVRNLSFEDAMAILKGGDTAATDYLRKTTGDELRKAFTPIVAKAMESTGVTHAYQELIHQAGPYLAMAGQKQDEDLTPYVTEKTLDGLFTLVAEQEKAIRKDPMQQTTDLLKKVFGTLTGNGS